MAYRSPKKLETLIATAFHDEEIQQGLIDADINEDQLFTNIILLEGSAWNSALEEIQQYENEETQYLFFKKKLDESRPLSPDQLPKIGQPGLLNLAIGPVLLAVTFIIYSIFFSRLGLKNFYSVTIKALWIKITVAAFLIAILFFTIRYLYTAVTWLGQRRRRKKVSFLFREWTLKNSVDLKKLDNLKVTLESLDKNIQTLIINRFIKEKIRDEINRVTTPSYSSLFAIKSASGLSEVMDASKTIDTASKINLHFLLHSMPGGSIGIAGPRGAGKSTLIKTYCGPERKVEKINGKTILPVFTTAPVQYDAREFILHLFSTTCQSVLKQEGVKLGIPEWKKEIEKPGSLAIVHALNEFWNFILPICRLVGPTVLFIGLFLSVLSLFQPAGYSGIKVNSDSAHVINNQTKQKDSVVVTKTSFSQTVLKIFATFGITPEPFTKWGFIITAIPIVQILRRRRSLRSLQAKRHRAPRGSPLAQMAQDWLHQIKYQQTFTTGWSGSLKLPIAESGLNKALTLAEKQMSNPDIVAAFTNFISTIPPEYQIIIGIDELDKLESDEKAQLFLNEIKSVFGLPRCFYLISVSENAMNQFERRGLPFRDVFDSSFDHIIHVDYLDLKGTKELLGRRVIGKPIPFFCLSYCLSGGLPRDLIRTFRQILELHSNHGNMKDLSTVTGAIIQNEVHSKIRAIGFAAKKMNLVQLVEPFFETIYPMQNQPITNESILDCLNLLSSLQKKSSSNASNDKLDEDQQSLLLLIEELWVFLYLMLTILNFFNNQLTEKDLRHAENKGLLDSLARAKQAFSIDVGMSKKIIDEFRQKNNLKIVA